MQRMVYEFQRTCDNNLSFEAFRQKIVSQMATFSKQKMTLDSLLGFENTKLINENKKREEMRIKKEEIEAKKKLELEKKQRKEERLKKKKEKEAADAAAAAATTAAPSTTVATTNPSTTAVPATATTVPATMTGAVGGGSGAAGSLAIKDDLLNESSVSAGSASVSGVPPIGIGPPANELDFSINDSNILNTSATDATKAGSSAAEVAPKSGNGAAKNENEQDSSKQSTQKIGEAIMANDHYTVFVAFNKIAGEELIAVPDTFLPDEQMKIARQKTMNNVIDIDPEYIEQLSAEISNVKTTFEMFEKLVATIEKLDACCTDTSPSLSSDGILDFIKDYLLANQIAEDFIASSEDGAIRASPFFEDFRTRILKYMDSLTAMLKKKFADFARFETLEGNATDDLKQACSLVLDYPHLETIMKKFASLNLTTILAEIYTDLNTKILGFMLAGAPGETASLLFETASPQQSEEQAALLNNQDDDKKTNEIKSDLLVKSYRRHEAFDEGIKLTSSSTTEEIKEFIDVLLNNAEKYYVVLQDFARVITSIPMEQKLEEFQDHLENLMEALMKRNIEGFSRAQVIEALSRFDSTMNAKNESFLFDMKGMAENLETTTVEEKLREGLLSLKNSMYTQMQALKESQDKDDYAILSELITYHFDSIDTKTHEIVDKKKKGGSANKKQCFEIVIMNYQIFTTILELFESELSRKTAVHYECLVNIVKKVQQRFQFFLDVLTSSSHLSDQQLMNKSLATYADLTMLSCNLTDSLAQVSN